MLLLYSYSALTLCLRCSYYALTLPLLYLYFVLTLSSLCLYSVLTLLPFMQSSDGCSMNFPRIQAAPTIFLCKLALYGQRKLYIASLPKQCTYLIFYYIVETLTFYYYFIIIISRTQTPNCLINILVSCVSRRTLREYSNICIIYLILLLNYSFSIYRKHKLEFNNCSINGINNFTRVSFACLFKHENMLRMEINNSNL